MSREEKINKMIEEIKIRRNDEQYRGGPFPIYHIEFDILNEEIERLNKERKTDIKYNKYLQKELAKSNSIIKEVREYIEKNIEYTEQKLDFDNMKTYNCALIELQKILDKESKNEN